MSPSTRFRVDDEALSRVLQLAEMTLSDGIPSNAEATSPYIDRFETEASRLVQFITTEKTTHEMKAKSLLEEIAANEIGGAEQPPNTLFWQTAKSLADSYKLSFQKLDEHIAKMAKTLRKIAAQADQKLGTSSLALLQGKLGPNPDISSSTFVAVLSDIYEAVRSAESHQNDISNKKWVAPTTFERKTIKYWIKSGRMVEVLLTSITLVPLLVYGESGRLTKDHVLKQSEGDKFWSSMATNISSVYFDSPSLCLYKDRISRKEGSQLFRIRWYGEDKPKGDELVFLELKTHHEKWINASSLKERVNIREKDVSPFLSRTHWKIQDAEIIVHAGNPELKGKDLDKAVDLLLRMHQLIVKHDLHPCLRSKYQRLAFQSSDSNKLRVTVDRNITLIDETRALEADWCIADSAIDEHMVKKVPYDVLEVKLAGCEMPESIDSLLQEGAILEAIKFSKFLSGAAAFGATKVSVLPYWAERKDFAPLFAGSFNPNGSVTSTPLFAGSFNPNGSVTSSNCMSVTDDNDGQVNPNDSVTSSNCTSVTDDNDGQVKEATNRFPFGIRLRHHSTIKPRIAPKQPARVEPKSYFANERTFIQWISASLLLVTVAVILLDFEPLHANYPLIKVGLGLLGCATLIIFYALYSYKRRVQLLKRGQNYGYVDHCGPVFLSCALCSGLVVLLVIFSDKLHQKHATSASTIQNSNECIQHEMAGLSLLEYEPSDILLQGDGRFLVPSLESIHAHQITGSVDVLVSIPGTDLEGLTSDGQGNIYALSEVSGKKSEVLQLAWTSEAMEQLDVVGRWEISTPMAEGIAFVPGMPDKLYVAGDLRSDDTDPTSRGTIDVYDVPSMDMDNPFPPTSHSLNSKLLNSGLEDSKISALQYFEGLLYVLHDNARVVRAWDLKKGELLSEWNLPQFSKQWEGMALERRQGANGVRGGSSKLLLHLALDSPPQVWSLAIQPGQTRGEFVLPECASA